MKENFDYFLFALTTLFTVVNPIGAMPFFTGLVEESGGGSNDAKAIARRASLTALGAMIFFALGGQIVFHFFNVSVDGLRVVGGILFILIGYEMLQGRESRTKSVSPSEKASLQDINIKAITPLAIPLICGPGSITVIIVHMEAATSLVQKLLLLFATVLVAAATYIILVSSKKIISTIGESGQRVFFRLMGLILMMIAVEYFFTGLKPYVHMLMQP